MTATVREGVIEQLRGTFRGEIVQPDDPSYETARRVWNGAKVQAAGRHRPLHRHRGRAGGRRVRARATVCLPSVRGGGHSIPGYSIVDDGLVIDCTPMKGIHVDPVAETAIAQPGLDAGRVRPRDAVFGLVIHRPARSPL